MNSLVSELSFGLVERQKLHSGFELRVRPVPDSFLTAESGHSGASLSLGMTLAVKSFV